MSEANVADKVPATQPRLELPLWLHVGAARFCSPVAVALMPPVPVVGKKG